MMITTETPPTVSTRLVGKLIRLRRAKKRVEKMEEQATAEVRQAMEKAKVTEVESPAGDVTMHTQTSYSIKAKKLIEMLTLDKAMRFLSVSNTPLKKAKGEEFITKNGKKLRTCVKLITKPAKVKDEVKVRVGGSI